LARLGVFALVFEKGADRLGHASSLLCVPGHSFPKCEPGVVSRVVNADNKAVRH
jgi:hypothetical protein